MFIGGSMQRSTFAVVLFAFITICSSEATAQQRPLVTEDPETVGTGIVLLEGGIDSQRDVFYPASGLHGDLLRAPTIGVSFGFSSILELQLDGGFYNRLHITSIDPAPLSDKLELSGDRATDIEDVVIATKIRLVTEAAGRPGIGVRFATKLPFAGNESGLGLDTIDFHMSALLGKTVQSVRVVGNFGLGILSDPVEGDRQNDVITYGLSVARALKQGTEFVGEINGRMNTRDERVPPGTESRSMLRVGLRYTRATVRVDGGLMFGLTSRDPNFGFTAGVTYVFKGFTLP
jgi:hypothetical protein